MITYYDHGGITIYCGDSATLAPTRISKPNTEPGEVFRIQSDIQTEETEQAIKEAIDELPKYRRCILHGCPDSEHYHEVTE